MLKKRLRDHVLTYGVTLDRQRRFAFFALPKCASQSVQRYLLKDRCVVQKDNRQAWLDELDTYQNENWKRLVRFAFVRNPWDHVVSAFYYLRQMMLVDQELSFNAFVMDVLAKVSDPSEIDTHFCRQAPKLQLWR